jgi:catechol 2,3-dioxygenase-like lactoylglutathione lyase family enzyme
MPGIKAHNFLWGRLRSPDLDQAEEFLVDFGLSRVARTKDKLFMRGTDPVHHIHVTELGPSKFLGFGYQLASEDDLKQAARLPGASGVETIDEPGGGKRVRLTDPNGYQIELVAGLEKVAELPVPEYKLNWGSEKRRRAGTLMRIARGPAQVKRIGHGVLMSTDINTTLKWYRENLGFLVSDDVYEGEDKSKVIGSFNRLDRGADYVDHHVFFCIAGPKTGLNHVSFEVRDFDDVMIGHEYLKAKGKYKHVWGIGRHVLGSQIYDYWQDPWGRVHEHWTDTDILNASAPANQVSTTEGFTSQWGQEIPQAFIEHAIP